MIDNLMDDVITGAATIIIGIFIINMMCENLLGFSPISFIRELIKKITHSD